MSYPSTMGKRRHPSVLRGPKRIPPAEAPADAVERIVPKRHVQVEPGDVVVTREPVPRVNPLTTLARQPWRYRLALFPEGPEGYRIFTSFQHAATEAEQVAAHRKARVMYVEDGIPSMLADHRPRNR
jgi:uncharacterized protein YbaR (Trm112 family)